MHHLLDTSTIIELGKFNLLDRFLIAFEIDRAEIFVLKEIWHKLSNNVPDWRGKKPFSEKHFKRLTDFCTGLEVIKEPYLDPVERNALQKIHPSIQFKIDEGERQLFAFSAQCPTFRIYSADRRALRALAIWPDCDTVRRRVAGKIICHERVIRQIVECCGFSKIPVAMKDCHQPFGPAIRAGETKCCGILKAAEAELQRQLGGLLIN